VRKAGERPTSARYCKTLPEKDTDILFNGLTSKTPWNSKESKTLQKSEGGGFGFQNIGNAAPVGNAATRARAVAMSGLLLLLMMLDDADVMMMHFFVLPALALPFNQFKRGQE
jgi:hypothetical protein